MPSLTSDLFIFIFIFHMFDFDVLLTTQFSLLLSSKALANALFFGVTVFYTPAYSLVQGLVVLEAFQILISS